jgi:hypothetical protein
VLYCDGVQGVTSRVQRTVRSLGGLEIILYPMYGIGEFNFTARFRCKKKQRNSMKYNHCTMPRHVHLTFGMPLGRLLASLAFRRCSLSAVERPLWARRCILGSSPANEIDRSFECISCLAFRARSLAYWGWKSVSLNMRVSTFLSTSLKNASPRSTAER